MPATYEPIATTTLGANAAEITFSGISSAYTDLVVILNFNLATNGSLGLRFNSDTGTNYSDTNLYGDGATAYSNRTTSDDRLNLDGKFATPTTQPKLAIVNIFSYTGSTNKTVLSQLNSDANGSGRVMRTVGLWRSTSAITSVTLRSGSNFTTGTTATLYGIKAA